MKSVVYVKGDGKKVSIESMCTEWQCVKTTIDTHSKKKVS